MQDTIQQIRKQCRLAMNGITSASMREKGVVYKLNFGLVLQQIKDIVKQYDKSKELAELLWKEDTRELKIMATLLYPVEDFSKQTADLWLSQITNQEMREQVCLNLFQNLPYALEKAKAWSNSNDINVRITGYWLLCRLILSKKVEEALFTDDFTYIWDDIISEDLFLRNSALLVVKHIGRQSKHLTDDIINKLLPYKDDSNPLKQEAYNNIVFELEFYFN